MHISTIALNPPLIVGETTINESDTLRLFCNGSNSAPQPTLQWISRNGKVVGESGELTLVTVTRNMAGTYTCVATFPGSTATMNTSVNITITPSKFGTKGFHLWWDPFVHSTVDCPSLNSTDAMVAATSLC